MNKSTEILIAEVTKSDSRRLQLQAFAAGYAWNGTREDRSPQFLDRRFLAARESDKRLFQTQARVTPWGKDIREVPIRELSALFTKGSMLDCTIPEGD